MHGFQAAGAVALVAMQGAAGLARAECPGDACAAYHFATTYTGDLLRNTGGGLRQGDAYLDNLDVTLSVDGEKAWGLPGLTVFAYGLYNNGDEFSGRYVGDAQAVSSIETGEAAVRLYELWADWTFGPSAAHSLRLGLYDLNSEFDVTDSAGLFTHSSHGMGAELALTGQNGPSIFPSTSLALRWHWQVAEHWAFQAVVLDGVPGDPDHPKRTTVDLGGDDGALLVAEVHYLGERLRKFNLGYWRYTEDFDDVLATEPGGDPVQQGGNDGVYAMADVALWSEAADGDQGVSGWVRYGVADDRVNQFDRYFGSGLVYTGILPGRDADQLGLAVAVARNGDPFRDAAVLAGSPLESAETNIELTYRAGITDWLTLQPTIQRIRNPGTDPALGNATVLGLRFELAWGRRFGG
jgi:porin